MTRRCNPLDSIMGVQTWSIQVSRIVRLSGIVMIILMVRMIIFRMMAFFVLVGWPAGEKDACNIWPTKIFVSQLTYNRIRAADR